MKNVFMIGVVFVLSMYAASAENLANPALNPVTFLPQSAGQPVVLVKDGAPAATVVITDKVLKSKKGMEFEAATELANFVKLATGAVLPIVSDTANIPGTLVLIGESRLTQEKGISAADLPPEGFRVKTFRNGLAIVGHAPVAGAELDRGGLLWGVYDVLERYLGIRWYYPGEDGRIIPQTKDFAVKPVHYTDHPVRVMRKITEAIPLQYRAANSTPIGMACHTPLSFHKVHFKDAPECFELTVDGKRNRGMPCYGNPKTVELMIQDLENFYTKGDNRPWLHYDGTCLWGPPTDKVYYISPSDKSVDCHCEYCTKLTDTGAKELGRTSKLVGLFVAKMATEIKKRWPNVVVHYMPYINYTLPPEGVVFPDNVVASVCMMHGAANDKEPAVAADNDLMIAGWVKLTGKPVRLWEYPCWPVDDTSLPFQYPHVVKAFHQRHRADVEGSYLCTGFYPSELSKKDAVWASQTPTMYCWFRVLWNPDFNVDAALSEYLDLMYGPAKEPMGEIVKTFTDRWENTRWQDPVAGHHISPRQVNEETMPRQEALKLKEMLAKARNLAGEDTVYRRRVDLCGKAVEIFLKESDNYHEGGKDLPTLTVLKVGGNPKLDGQLDDPCWKDAVAQPFKMAYDKVNTVPVNGTTVQAVWTDTGVTFGFKLTEPDVDKIKATCTRHDQDVYGDDSIEMFLDISGERKKYYQIVANSLGAIYDGTAEGKDWNANNAKAVAYKGKDFWSLEIFVPFSGFSEKPEVKIGSVWYANFMRERYREKWELQRWSTLYGQSNLNFSAFGKLRFVE